MNPSHGFKRNFISTYEALSDKMKARYDPKDVDRVRNDPEYVASFVLAKSMQRSEAFAMLERFLRWRKQFVSTLTRGIVDDDVLSSNALFFLGVIAMADQLAQCEWPATQRATQSGSLP